MTSNNPNPRNQGYGLIGWFASNPVAANLLMLLILCGGGASLYFMEKDVFPRFLPHEIMVTALYPGASPLELEESVCIRIEEAIYKQIGVKRLKSTIMEGQCQIKVALLPKYDRDQMMMAIRGRVEAIPNLPKQVEKIDVGRSLKADDDGTIWVALHGPTDLLSLKSVGERIHNDLSAIPNVTFVDNYFDIPYEIDIELSSERLRQYHLSLHDVAEAVRHASVDLPGGLVKSPAGELLLRVKGKAQQGAAVGDLVLLTLADGTRVRLADVAVIRDGVKEHIADMHHNGETAMGWAIYADSNMVDVARRVKAYVQEMRTKLPEQLQLITWWDDSQAYDERVKTLIEDGLSGFVLVCVVLTLFLRLQVALWAGAGILTSLFGAFWLMPALHVSLNMLSLFGFLLAMGILVDDAIIIGEAVHTRQQQSTGDYLGAAIRGTREVALPVILAVLIAMVAFLPGLFLPGWAGQMMKPICLVMILTLVFSLVEALLILPAHLAHPPRTTANATRLARLRTYLNQGLDNFVRRYYAPFLEKAMAWRYLTMAAFAVFIMLGIALVQGGHVRLSLRADVTKSSFWAELQLPQNTPYSETIRIAGKVERALLELRDELDSKAKKPSGFSLFTSQEKTSCITGLETYIAEHQAAFFTELSPQGRQNIKVEDFIQDWRKRVGDPGLAQISFFYKEGDTPYDIEFDLGADDPSLLPSVAAALKQKLASYPGVSDIADSAQPGKAEIRLRLKPAAERFELRLDDIAEQMRNAYSGEEVHRFQRGRNEVKVMVRLPRNERQSLDDLRNLPIKLPGDDGAQAPLSSLADIELTPGYAQLLRQNRHRILKVFARVDSRKADINAIYADLATGTIPQLQQRFPGLSVDIGEERQEQNATLRALGLYTVISLIVIYALIAVPFRSYTKPLIFLLAAPVAWCGAIQAHWLLGLPLSMESMVGMIAASGVVINDSLVLLDYIKENESSDRPLSELIYEACTTRFRPILLAFLTNFAGFLPTLLETSEQAQFLIPMTLSLSAGLLVGMAASLILTPVCYAVLEKR